MNRRPNAIPRRGSSLAAQPEAPGFTLSGQSGERPSRRAVFAPLPLSLAQACQDLPFVTSLRAYDQRHRPSQHRTQRRFVQNYSPDQVAESRTHDQS